MNDRVCGIRFDTVTCRVGDLSPRAVIELGLQSQLTGGVLRLEVHVDFVPYLGSYPGGVTPYPGNVPGVNIEQIYKIHRIAALSRLSKSPHGRVTAMAPLWLVQQGSNSPVYHL